LHYVGGITQVENVYGKNVQLAIGKLAQPDIMDTGVKVSTPPMSASIYLTSV